MEENTGRKKSGFAAGLLTGIVIMLMISILGFGGDFPARGFRLSDGCSCQSDNGSSVAYGEKGIHIL